MPGNTEVPRAPGNRVILVERAGPDTGDGSHPSDKRNLCIDVEYEVEAQLGWYPDDRG